MVSERADDKRVSSVRVRINRKAVIVVHLTDKSLRAHQTYRYFLAIIAVPHSPFQLFDDQHSRHLKLQQQWQAKEKQWQVFVCACACACVCVCGGGGGGRGGIGIGSCVGIGSWACAYV